MILTATKVEKYSTLATVSTTLLTISVVLGMVTSIYMAKKEKIKIMKISIGSIIVGFVITLAWAVVNMSQQNPDCNNLNIETRKACSIESFEMNHLPLAVMFIALTIIFVNISCIVFYMKFSKLHATR